MRESNTRFSLSHIKLVKLASHHSSYFELACVRFFNLSFLNELTPTPPPANRLEHHKRFSAATMEYGRNRLSQLRTVRICRVITSACLTGHKLELGEIQSFSINCQRGGSSENGPLLNGYWIHWMVPIHPAKIAPPRETFSSPYKVRHSNTRIWHTEESDTQECYSSRLLIYRYCLLELAHPESGFRRWQNSLKV